MGRFTGSNVDSDSLGGASHRMGSHHGNVDKSFGQECLPSWSERAATGQVERAKAEETQGQRLTMYTLPAECKQAMCIIHNIQSVSSVVV